MLDEVSCHYGEFNEDHSFCQRTGQHMYYAIGGIVCQSLNHIGRNYCKLGKIIYAVNFHDVPHTDSRGIYHKTSNKSDWELQPDVWWQAKSRINVEQVPQSDVKFYENFTSGEWVSINKTRSVAVGCAVLPFEIDGDGTYEISMKTGELWWPRAERQNRTFSVLLNDIYIVKEFVVERYRESPLGMELAANFEILGNEKLLRLQGHPTKEISSVELRLEFCHSECTSEKLGFWVDRNWVLYGLSIIKFDK